MAVHQPRSPTRVLPLPLASALFVLLALLLHIDSCGSVSTTPSGTTSVGNVSTTEGGNDESIGKQVDRGIEWFRTADYSSWKTILVLVAIVLAVVILVLFCFFCCCPQVCVCRDRERERRNQAKDDAEGMITNPIFENRTAAEMGRNAAEVTRNARHGGSVNSASGNGSAGGSNPTSQPVSRHASDGRVGPAPTYDHLSNDWRQSTASSGPPAPAAPAAPAWTAESQPDHYDHLAQGATSLAGPGHNDHPNPAYDHIVQLESSQLPTYDHLAQSKERDRLPGQAYAHLHGREVVDEPSRPGVYNHLNPSSRGTSWHGQGSSSHTHEHWSHQRHSIHAHATLPEDTMIANVAYASHNIASDSENHQPEADPYAVPIPITTTTLLEAPQPEPSPRVNIQYAEIQGEEESVEAISGVDSGAIDHEATNHRDHADAYEQHVLQSETPAMSVIPLDPLGPVSDVNRDDEPDPATYPLTSTFFSGAVTSETNVDGDEEEEEGEEDGEDHALEMTVLLADGRTVRRRYENMKSSNLEVDLANAPHELHELVFENMTRQESEATLRRARSASDVAATFLLRRKNEYAFVLSCVIGEEVKHNLIRRVDKYWRLNNAILQRNDIPYRLEGFVAFLQVHGALTQNIIGNTLGRWIQP